MDIFNHFAQLRVALHEESAKIVRKTAYDIEVKAKELAAVDKGFMQSSVYMITSDSSDYGSNIVAQGEMLPEMERPSDDLEAWIAVAAAYGIYVEMGTVHGPSQPFMAPAAEHVRPSWEQSMQNIEARLGGR